MLIRKTGREIWLNRVRVWLPPVLVAAALAVQKPACHWWGVPLVVLGEALRTWASGHLLKDEALTVGGPYAYVRNPLYLGSLVSTIGFLVILGSVWLGIAVLAIALAIYLPTVKQEENYLRRMHGEAYEQYRRRVPGLIPRPCRADMSAVPSGSMPAETTRRDIPSTALGVNSECPALQPGFEWRRAWLNKEHQTWVGLVVLFALLVLRARL